MSLEKFIKKVIEKVNLIDLFAVLFIILIISIGTYQSVKKYTHTQENIQNDTFQELVLDAEFQIDFQPDYLANNINPGDYIMDKGTHDNISKINNVTITSPWYDKPEIKNIKIFATLKAEKDKENVLHFNNQELKIGKTIDISTEKTRIQAILTYLKDDKNNTANTVLLENSDSSSSNDTERIEVQP
jgi:hypothetical protein